METDYRIYVRIDWGSEAHQACVLDHERRIVAERSFAHAGNAIVEFRMDAAFQTPKTCDSKTQNQPGAGRNKDAQLRWRRKGPGGPTGLQNRFARFSCVI